ncbi:MAG: GntR family transcriptional regulator [Anaerolineae bacterium]|nr:GntR family transcriptional regulator [Anaerolineae bacterium]
MTQEHRPPVGGILDLTDLAAMRADPAPLYHSLGHIIRSKVQGGEWRPGEQIPSERQLMELSGLSRATVRQGIEYLVREGILYRVQGKGTFVAAPKIKQGVLRLFDFSDTMRRNGLKPSARLLGKGHDEPPPNVRRALALPTGATVIWIQRLLLVNAEPMLIETCYLPQQRFPDLLEAYDEVEDVHRFVGERYGARVTSSSDGFEPVILESREAAVLGVRAGFPALWVEQVGMDEAGAPIVFHSSLLRGDRCRFYVGLALA